MRRVRSSLLMVLIFAAHSVDAQVIPAGGEFQVNSYTTGRQLALDVAADAQGNFVVVWESYGSIDTDSSSSSIQAQRYSAGGAPLGGQFQVNSYTTDFQGFPSVASSSTGSFVVVWESYGSFGADTSRSIQAQRFSSNGAPLGPQFQVNSYSTGMQAISHVASDRIGNFVVTWMSLGAFSDTSGRSVQAQLYDSAGIPQGGQFQVNTYSTGDQNDNDVSMDPSGNFIVVWDSWGSAGSDSSMASIQAQRFSASGTPLGAQFQVNAYSSGGQNNPSVAADAQGRFVVAWSSAGSSYTDSSSRSVQIQRYSADGTLLGGEFQVNSYTTGGQTGVDVSADDQGRFTVTWESMGSSGADPSTLSVQAKHFRANGVPDTGDFQVNTFTQLSQYAAQVVSTPAGNLIVAWQSEGSAGTDSSDFSIQGQRFDVGLIFRDGFESQDTMNWSQTLP